MCDIIACECKVKGSPRKACETFLIKDIFVFAKECDIYTHLYSVMVRESKKMAFVLK